MRPMTSPPFLSPHPSRPVSSAASSPAPLAAGTLPPRRPSAAASRFSSQPPCPPPVQENPTPLSPTPTASLARSPPSAPPAQLSCRSLPTSTARSLGTGTTAPAARVGKTHGLLIEGGLTQEAIKQSVADAAISFRDGVVELFEFLEARDVPVLVFSAGLADIIEEVFRQKLHRSFKNIKIVSNRMVFNEKGRLVAFKGKTIHVLNKNEHSLDMAAPVHDSLKDPNGSTDDYSLVKKRTNVLLLGDHIGDLGMSDGLNYENRIAAGFLNTNIEKSLKDYSEAFDIVYLNDAPMWGAVELVSDLCP